MEFAKWEALGNDYVILDEARGAEIPDADAIRLICDRHRGVGGDGVLLVGPPPSPSVAATLRIFNADGSEAEISGNGARQAFLYLSAEGRAPGDRFSIATSAGVIDAEIQSPSRARVGMGTAVVRSAQYPEGEQDGRGTIAAGGELWAFQHVSIGNPQCAIRVQDLDALEELAIAAPGHEIENAPAFPGRTNVSWWAELSPGRIRARLYERGVGETTASGTGACGAAVDYHLRGGGDEVTVVMDGGELQVDIGEGLEVWLTGEAHELFRGEIAPGLAARIEP